MGSWPLEDENGSACRLQDEDIISPLKQQMPQIFGNWPSSLVGDELIGRPAAEPPKLGGNS